MTRSREAIARSREAITTRRGGVIPRRAGIIAATIWTAIVKLWTTIVKEGTSSSPRRRKSARRRRKGARRRTSSLKLWTQTGRIVTPRRPIWTERRRGVTRTRRIWSQTRRLEKCAAPRLLPRSPVMTSPGDRVTSPRRATSCSGGGGTRIRRIGFRGEQPRPPRLRGLAGRNLGCGRQLELRPRCRRVRPRRVLDEQPVECVRSVSGLRRVLGDEQPAGRMHTVSGLLRRWTADDEPARCRPRLLDGPR